MKGIKLMIISICFLTTLASCKKDSLIPYYGSESASSNSSSLRNQASGKRLASIQSQQIIGLQVSQPGFIKYTYSADGKLISTVNEQKETYNFNYLSPGIIKKTGGFSNIEITYKLSDINGKSLVTQVSEPSFYGGKTITDFTYDGKNRIIKSQIDSNPNENNYYKYDADDNLVLQPESQGGKIISYKYDLSKLNVRPSTDVERRFILINGNYAPAIENVFAGKGRESKNLLTERTEQDAAGNIFTTTYTYTFDKEGYVTKKIEVITSSKKGSPVIKNTDIYIY